MQNWPESFFFMSQGMCSLHQKKRGRPIRRRFVFSKINLPQNCSALIADTKRAETTRYSLALPNAKILRKVNHVKKILRWIAGSLCLLGI
jgi:hypothetical protein